MSSADNVSDVHTGKLDKMRASLAALLPPHHGDEVAVAETLRRRADNVPEEDNDLPADSCDLLLTLNGEMDRRLDRQWDSITQLDTKAGLLVTFELTAAGLLLSRPHGCFVYAALISFGIALLLTLACLAVRSWSNVPRPDVLVDLESAVPTRAYDRLIKAKAKADLRNQVGVLRKAEWLKIATWWLAVPVGLTAAAFLTS